MIDPKTLAAIREEIIKAFPSGDIYDETDSNRLLDTSPFRARAAQIGSKVKALFHNQPLRISAEGHGEGGTCTWITIEKDAPNAFTMLAYISYVGPYAYISDIDPENPALDDVERQLQQVITENGITILDHDDATSETTRIADFPPGSGESVPLPEALFNEGV